MLGRRRRGGTVVVAGLVLSAIGCGEDTQQPVEHDRVVGAQVEHERVMGPLSTAPGTNPAPTTAVARAHDVSVDARLLVITGDGSNAAFTAITTALAYLGTPYDVLDASSARLTAGALAAGNRGRYHGILLDTGDLAVGSASGFSDAEWMTLASYEARFGVRRAVLYAVPTAAYGLRSVGGFDVKERPIGATCTAPGSKAFVGANCAVPVWIRDGWAYASQPTDASTVPLLIDGAGNAYAATHRYPDGREALVLTFSQSPTAMHTLGLVYGVVSWVARGLFIGERHVYASPQLDDWFLPSAVYPSSSGITYRSSAADLQAFAAWQNARQSDPVTAGFRSAFAFNAYGARPAGEDGLTDKTRELGSAFTWINHTWDHKTLTRMAHAEAFEEFSKNDQYGQANLSPYRVENLVTPGISGLDNAEVMRAAYDAGVRYLVSDTSLEGQDNPSPNAGYHNALAPGLLMVPRRPTDLYFNVSQPSEWVAEYAALNSGTFSYEQIIDAASDVLVRYMLRGENDPWMFHQANIRDIGGGVSLFSTLLDAVLDKYRARATFPVLSPTMDELAQRVKARMAFDAAGVHATIEPGGKLIIRVANAAIVPVTGLCTRGAERYAGQTISYLELAAGQALRLSLTDCNPGIASATTQGKLNTAAASAENESATCAVRGGARGGADTAGLLSIALAVAVAARRRRGATNR
jgi:peptidoglycan/xylan/chitin deacetylase (PgdA/CDA1 family)